MHVTGNHIQIEFFETKVNILNGFDTKKLTLQEKTDRSKLDGRIVFVKWEVSWDFSKQTPLLFCIMLLNYACVSITLSLPRVIKCPISPAASPEILLHTV